MAPLASVHPGGLRKDEFVRRLTWERPPACTLQRSRNCEDAQIDLYEIFYSL